MSPAEGARGSRSYAVELLDELHVFELQLFVLNASGARNHPGSLQQCLIAYFLAFVRLSSLFITNTKRTRSGLL